jgi:hypothetical protein
MTLTTIDPEIRRGGPMSDVTPVPRSDPWWGLEGKAARIRRLRHRRQGDMAFVLALLSLALVLGLWMDRLLGLLGS